MFGLKTRLGRRLGKLSDRLEALRSEAADLAGTAEGRRQTLQVMINELRESQTEAVEVRQTASAIVHLLDKGNP